MAGPVLIDPKSLFDTHHPPAQELLAECVHCGFCLPACPTYLLWREEMDSPRGRIYLMQMALNGNAEAMDATMVQHFDRCLGLHELHDRLSFRREIRQAHRGHARPSRT